MNEDEEDPVERKRRKANERKQRWWAKQSQESRDKINAANAAAHRQAAATNSPEQSQARREANAASLQLARQRETPEQSQARREANAASLQLARQRETPEQSQARRGADAASRQLARQQETPEQSQARRTADLQNHRLAQERRSQAIRNEAINLDEAQVNAHICGKLDVTCQFCGSRNFIAERPSDKKFTSCCRKGKVKLPKPVDVNGVELEYPEFLRNLLSDQTHPNHANFREHIRSYNSAVSFASMGAKIVDLPGRGPFVFKVQGQTYHRTSHLQPMNDQTPKFAQLYVLDSTQATEVRKDQAANAQCLEHLLYEIDRFFRQHNRLSHTYQLMREVEMRESERARQTGEEIPVVSMALRRDRQSDQRRYNSPTSNEVAMVFVNEDGEPPFERDIRIYPRNPQNADQQFINLNILSPNMDPMTYAIFYPYGEPGWQPNWQCEAYEGAQLNRVRNNVSMLQFKAAQTAIRDNCNPIMSAGNLTQQWLVDSYLQVEANNLNYIRHHQQQLRVEQHQGLADHVANLAENAHISAGVAVILPSSFEGSPRNMRERCCDAMSIFARWGAPDLFITFTANPSWPEITENMRPGEHSSDRPDLIARVFKIKLDTLINDLTKHGVLGQSKAYVYSIEFQKRGLPHSHILVTLRAEDQFTTTERIDQFVCAEIPAHSSPRLREIILRCMMHGPCGTVNPHAPCMKDGKCSKDFPKTFNDVTVPSVSGYPIYRRRPGEQAHVRSIQMDNRFVVPYSPYLMLKYNAHINVEVCTSLHAIKYIYKYIYKGFDCANIAITSDGQPELRYNEISNFIDCRYVSAPEAMWRLLESKMHDCSHTVIRLPV